MVNEGFSIIELPLKDQDNSSVQHQANTGRTSGAKRFISFSINMIPLMEFKKASMHSTP